MSVKPATLEPMPTLKICLFGTVTASIDDTPIAFATNKVRALLSYLAAEQTQAHDRNYLAGLLWPDILQKSARNNLRQALSHLRRAVGDSRRDVPFVMATRLKKLSIGKR